MGDELRQYKQGGHVYILDACRADEDGTTMTIKSEHAQKNNMVRRVVEKCTPYMVHELRFPKKTRPEAVAPELIGKIQQHSEDELIIIYYHGRAGQNGIDYAW